MACPSVVRSSWLFPQNTVTGAALPRLLSVGYPLKRGPGLGARDGYGCTPDTLFPAGEQYNLFVFECKSPQVSPKGGRWVDFPALPRVVGEFGWVEPGDGVTGVTA